MAGEMENKAIFQLEVVVEVEVEVGAWQLRIICQYNMRLLSEHGKAYIHLSDWNQLGIPA